MINVNSSWPLYSTTYYPMLRYRKYDGVPIYQNCEFVANIKLTVNNNPHFAKIYIKLDENNHIIKELENNNKEITWEIIEDDTYYILVVKSRTSNSVDYIQIKLENYRNRGFVELLNYKEPINIENYNIIPKESIVPFINSSCTPLKYKYIGDVTVYNQQYNITKFMIVQTSLERNSILYAEFILRIINGTPTLILLSHSDDFQNTLINIHVVKDGSKIKLYWENKYSTITNKIIIKQLFDINSSQNSFIFDNTQEPIDDLTPTISLL